MHKPPFRQACVERIGRGQVHAELSFTKPATPARRMYHVRNEVKRDWDGKWTYHVTDVQDIPPQRSVTVVHLGSGYTGGHADIVGILMRTEESNGDWITGAEGQEGKKAGPRRLRGWTPAPE
jgi:hypothetical protein